MPPPARRLLNVAQQLLRTGPKAALRAIHEGELWVNRRPAMRGEMELKVGDVVEVVRTPRPSAANVLSDRGPVVVAYEDEDLIVVEKPPGLLTVPTPFGEKQTLISEVQRLLDASPFAGQACCVHRLDRGVSGLLAFARSVEMAERLRDQFAARKPRRRYTAFVFGVPQPATGEFRSYLATGEGYQRYSVPSSDQGELAITHYQVVESLGDVAVADVRLETGRRNQIRVHFSEAGHPVIGDRRYHGQFPPHPQWPYRRVALHARELGLAHPRTDAPLYFRADLPREMNAFLRILRRARK